MNEIVIISGKGGTGKTSITAALGALAGQDAVVADCDVDAANMHLLYNPKIESSENFWSGKSAVIDYNRCIDCGNCSAFCRFNAIRLQQKHFIIDEINCEGCSLCSHICPENAIIMETQKAGDWFISKSKFDSWLIYAKLGIAKENSGKLVNKVKSLAREIAKNKDLKFILIDGPPGLGCPTISSLSGANQVLIVTEASNSGYHDLCRLITLIKHFKIPASCIINKSDLNSDSANQIEEICNQNNIRIVSKIPFTLSFNEALKQGLTLAEYDDEILKTKINQIWKQINNGRTQ
jgi:MinD superfamily P-loop ATPase